MVLSPKSPWFSFRLRTVLVVLAVSCVAFTPVAVKLRNAMKQKEAQNLNKRVIKQVRDRDGTIWFAHEKTPQGYSKDMAARESDDGVIHGVDLRDTDRVTDDLLADISRLPELRFVHVSPPVAQLPGFQPLRETDAKVSIQWAIRHAPITTITSVGEFQQVVSAGECVLFIDGDWSFPAAFSRPIFSELAHNWHKGRMKPTSVRFVRLDLTRSDTPLWRAAQDWLASKKIPTGGLKRYGGVGRLIWIRDGNVVESVWDIAGSSRDAELKRTQSLFQTKIISRPILTQ